MYVEWITGTYVEPNPGATTNDGTAVETTGSVNVGVLGTYTIRYNATDSNGNAAIEKTRSVIVRDKTPPVITVLGSGTDPNDPITLQRGSTYTDAGATATEGLTSYIVTTFTNPAGSTLPFSSFPSPVLINGTYTIKYNVSDTTGDPPNKAQEQTRSVVVIDDQINNNGTITAGITSNNQNNNQLAKSGEYVTISLVETGIDVLTITSTSLQIDGIEVDPNWISKSSSGTNVSVYYLVQEGDNGDVTFAIGVKDEYNNSTTISATTDGTSMTVDTTCLLYTSDAADE